MRPGFEVEGFDTVGSLVLGLLGHPPEVGDKVRVGNRGLRVESVDELRVGHVTVREEPAEAHTRGDDRHRVFLHLDDADHNEHLAVTNKVESLLDERPGSEFELVVVGNVATSSQVNLLGLLTGRGLGVAVCGSTLRVWRPRGAPALRVSRATRGVGYARGRPRGPR